MILTTILAAAAGYAYYGYKEWKKAAEIIKEEEEVATTLDGNSVSFNFKEFARRVLKDKALQFNLNTTDWFNCINNVKISVEKKDEETVSLLIWLPDYLKGCNLRVPDFIREVSRWKKEQSLRSPIKTELRFMYTETESGEEEGEEPDAYTVVIPDEITADFADDYDPTGANRMYEAIQNKRTPNHNAALEALNGVVKSAYNPVDLRVVVRLDIPVDKEEKLIKRLSENPLLFERDGQKMEPENLLISTTPSVYFDLNEAGDDVEEYSPTFC